MCRVIEEALRVRLRKGVRFNCEKNERGERERKELLRLRRRGGVTQGPWRV